MSRRFVSERLWWLSTCRSPRSTPAPRTLKRPTLRCTQPASVWDVSLLPPRLTKTRQTSTSAMDRAPILRLEPPALMATNWITQEMNAHTQTHSHWDDLSPGSLARHRAPPKFRPWLDPPFFLCPKLLFREALHLPLRASLWTSFHSRLHFWILNYAVQKRKQDNGNGSKPLKIF